MAQKVQVVLVDDIDGGEAVETVSFSLDGVSYEIDLSEEHAGALRDAFAPWVGHARKVSGGGGGRRRSSGGSAKQRGGGSSSSSSSSSSSAGTSGGPDSGAVRTWARENGYTVSDRGRISAEIVKAYEDAQG